MKALAFWNMCDMSVIAEVSQLETLPLKEVAYRNIACIDPDMPVVVQVERSWLKAVALWNMDWKLLTLDTFQLAKELLNAVAPWNICCIETALVVLMVQFARLWLNAVALWNIATKLLTLDTFQSAKELLNAVAFWNMAPMFVTLVVFHEPMF